MLYYDHEFFRYESDVLKIVEILSVAQNLTHILIRLSQMRDVGYTKRDPLLGFHVLI
jgi:hypothetical protein